MALISCPECDKDVSDQSKACPHCGFPTEKIFDQTAHTAGNDRDPGPERKGEIQNEANREMGWMNAAIIVIAAAGLVWAVGKWSDDGPSESPQQVAPECITPSAEFADELSTFFTSDVTLQHITAVRSESHGNMFYVAAYLVWPDASARALFAASTIEEFGMFYAVDSVARSSSTLLDGRRTKGRFSTAAPAARQAKKCLDEIVAVTD